jgi:PAS domain S-box-containing protein
MLGNAFVFCPIIIGQIKSGNRVDHFETVRKTKSGDPVSISVTVSPVADDEGEIIGASKIARDIGKGINVLKWKKI